MDNDAAALDAADPIVDVNDEPNTAVASSSAYGINDICLLIDYRERALLREALPFTEWPFSYTVVNCDVGDIVVALKTGGSAPRTPGMLSAVPSSSSSSSSSSSTSAGGLGGAAPQRAATGATEELCAELRPLQRMYPILKFPVPFVDDAVYEPLFVIERKLVPDLVNSIRGRGSNGTNLNRFKDQKLRLLSYAQQNGCRPYLLVEGLQAYGAGQMIEGMPERAIDTALTNTHARDGIYVERRTSLHDTARWLGTLCGTAVKHQLRAGRAGNMLNVTRDALTDLGQAISLKKSDNLTPALAYRTWLMTARGMTFDKTEPIMAAYPTLAGLVAAYNDLEQRTLARKTPRQTAKALDGMLADIIVPGQVTPNGHGKRIGPAISKAIRLRLFGGGVPPPDPLDGGEDGDKEDAVLGKQQSSKGKKRKVMVIDDYDDDGGGDA